MSDEDTVRKLVTPFQRGVVITISKKFNCLGWINYLPPKDAKTRGCSKRKREARRAELQCRPRDTRSV